MCGSQIALKDDLANRVFVKVGVLKELQSGKDGRGERRRSKAPDEHLSELLKNRAHHLYREVCDDDFSNSTRETQHL